MGAEIVGYDQLSDRARFDLNKFLSVHGASISFSEAEITTSGLILATRPDMVAYNETLNPPKREDFVSRCWGMPLERWHGYREALVNPDFNPSVRKRKMLKQSGSVNGFKDLFTDATHMNVSILKLCLDDGMTREMYQMGPKMNDFLTGFADTTIKSAQSSLQN